MIKYFKDRMLDKKLECYLKEGLIDNGKDEILLKADKRIFKDLIKRGYEIQNILKASFLGHRLKETGYETIRESVLHTAEMSPKETFTLNEDAYLFRVFDIKGSESLLHVYDFDISTDEFTVKEIINIDEDYRKKIEDKLQTYYEKPENLP